MSGNSIKVGTFWSFIGQIIEAISKFSVLIIVSRYFGPEKYGLLQTVLALIILSVMISNFGVPASVSRFIAVSLKNVKELNKIIYNGISLVLLTCILSLIVIVFLFPIVERVLSNNLSDFRVVFFILTFFRCVYEFNSRVFQGQRRLDISTKLSITNSLIYLILVVFSIVLGYGIISVLYAEVISVAITSLMGLRKISEINNFSMKLEYFDKKIIKKILGYSSAIFVSSLGYYIYTKSDTIQIQYFLDSKSVGIYSIVLTLVSNLQLPLVAIGRSSAPAFATMEKRNIAEKFYKILLITLVIVIPMSVGLYLISEELIIGIFGIEYNQSIIILQLFCVFLFWYSLNSVFSPILDYLGYARNRSILVTITSLSNIILNIYFIPTFGVKGAVYSTLITYSIYSLIVTYSTCKICIAKENRYFSNIFIKLLKILASTFILIIVVELIKKFFENNILTIVLSVSVASIMYFFCLSFLKVINLKDYFRRSN